MKANKFLEDIMGEYSSEDENSQSLEQGPTTSELPSVASDSKWQPVWGALKTKGRNHTKSFREPQDLWAAACDYFDFVQRTPIVKKEFIKTGPYAGTSIDVEYPRPFSWSALNVFLTTTGVTTSFYRYRYNDGNAYDDYQPIIKLIEDVMFSQKFEGAAVGLFKENIVSREIGLAEKNSTSISIDQPLFDLE